jgi:hypothetical protein
MALSAQRDGIILFAIHLPAGEIDRLFFFWEPQ